MSSELTGAPRRWADDDTLMIRLRRVLSTVSRSSSSNVSRKGPEFTSAPASASSSSHIRYPVVKIPFPWIFETVLSYPVFAANSKPSFTKQLFSLLIAPSHPSPAPQIRTVNRRHCALYKFIYLLTYLRYLKLSSFKPLDTNSWNTDRQSMCFFRKTVKHVPYPERCRGVRYLCVLTLSG